MMSPLLVSVFALCLQVAHFTDPEGCVIELECEECLPDHMPAVTSHAVLGGDIRLAHGDEITLECGGGAFLAYPLRRGLAAVCERGRYRVRHDSRLLHLLDLGCQENIFEDVLHPTERCAAPLQGRAYLRRGAGGARHLAALCYDADGALAVWARARGPPPAPHDDGGAPLSLLGNFNHMFDASTRRDAERLYSDDARLTRRVQELVKHERFTLAGQTLTSGRLLAAEYLEAGEARATQFASNRVAVWSSVAAGNLRLLQADVAARARAGGVQVAAGTHGVLARPAPLHLRAPRRFPVPQYIWTAVLSADGSRGLALVLLNDPFVTVSEIRTSVFCESACSAVSWLTELRRHRNYERPINGLVFCCSLPDFARVVTEMPRIFNDSIQILN